MLPRVLLVGPRPDPPFHGGVEKGVDMLLRTRLAGRTGMRLFNNFRTRDPHRSLLERLRYQAGMVRSFRRELKRSAPDLVHVKTSSGVNFCQNSLYVHLGRLARRPVLLQIHCGKFEAFYRNSPGLLRAWIRYTLTRARSVAVLSRFWQERITILAPGVRLVLVPNGLEPEEMERLAGPMAAGPIQALFMGTGERQLNREKGLEELLSVLPVLVADYPEVSWVLAGLESPDEAERFWSERRLRRPPEDRVICRGLVSGEERVRLIKESLLLVLPSHFENMPNLVLEAMAAGAAVAASSVGALPEMLRDSEGGFLFPPADAAALEAALRRALDEGPRLAHRGRRNREVVERDYTMAVVESRLEAIYLDLAGRSQAVSSHAGDLVGAEPERSRAGRP